jgi:putative mRNA 3-end processing factor
MHRLLSATDSGLYCPEGDFWIDPHRPVPSAVVTHAHSDHARPGCRRYLSTRAGAELLRLRVGRDITLQAPDYGETVDIKGVRVSLHPAGHILGSAQVRIEHRGEVVVVGGDYKRAGDPTCQPFEPLQCHVFVTEATFALPIFRWSATSAVIADMRAWIAGNRANGRTSVVLTYALGKAQRLLAELGDDVGPIFAHGAVTRFLDAYTAAGVKLPAVQPCVAAKVKALKGAAVVIAPPSVRGSTWLRRLGDSAVAFASGWMRIRGRRRQHNLDRGFVLSDHADWPGLLATIEETQAEQVLITHGRGDALARWLSERGVNAQSITTRPVDTTEAEDDSAESVEKE